MNTQEYFERLHVDVEKVYDLANSARVKGFDPVDEVEIPLAMSMAEKVVGLISTIYPQMKDSGISKRIIELEKEYGKLDPTVVFKIAEEVSEQKFCKFKDLIESIDAGIRIGFAYITLGVVSSPLEGFTGLKVGKTRDGKEYLNAYFSGPIRSAGTTASCLVLMLIDFLREKYGFAKYDPTEEEAKRVYVELEHFNDRVANLQYMPTEEEALFLARNIPIQVSGEPSEKIEVPNYKNLERVDTNFLRSGFCLILGEGLAQKAAKGFRLLNQAKKNGIHSTGFDFIEDYLKIHEKREKGKSDESPTYIKDLVAGRPVFGHPSRSGGFRFRYGRGRNSGFSAAAVHPATMAVTDNFIAIGTQLKIEKPTKGCVTTVCDTVEGPIVKLKNGDVIKVSSLEEGEKIYSNIDEVIYLGDILFPFSDVANRNALLLKPGFVEEWWALELKEKNEELYRNLNPFEIKFKKAIEISRNEKIPLHPSFTFYWTQISKEELENLLEWLRNSWVEEKLILPFTKKDKESFGKGKRALELLGVPHKVTLENVVLNKEDSEAFLFNMGISFPVGNDKVFLKSKIDKIYSLKINFSSPLDLVNVLCDFEIKDRAGDFIGSRMGRPEKAKVRKLTGSPNVLFPVGKEGGRLRSIYSACEAGSIRNNFPLFYCENCKKETIYPHCFSCGKKAKQMYYFYDTKEKSFEKTSKVSLKEGKETIFKEVNVCEYLDVAREKVGLLREQLPPLIKGVRGMSSDSKIPENLIKGILRAKYGLQVNKDGTIRMDATELPLVSFKPKEIRTSVSKLRELGYDKDIYGKELVNENQILELMPHDVLIPDSSGSPDEKGGDVFLNISQFMDELLAKMYGMKPFYNASKKEDIIGHLGVCMAPHNCAGVVCRFIGFPILLV